MNISNSHVHFRESRRTILAAMSESEGASIGILMLDTRFPRIYGDLGNSATWPFDVHFEVVRGATAGDVVSSNGLPALQPFITAAKTLECRGVAGITTSCGFLSLAQKTIATAVNIPFVASSLMQIPLLDAMLAPGKRAGILTIDSRALTSNHLYAAGASIDTPIVGTENGSEFTQAILSDAETMDIEKCRIDNMQAALMLIEKHPAVGAIVLECTNMVPYALDIREVTGLPVFSIYSFVSWFHSGLAPRGFTKVPDGANS